MNRVEPPTVATLKLLPMRKPSEEERKALGAFLATRRGRLQPTDIGIAAGQRRTPGLRREEVAVLAGISNSWYTWLEQGRDIHVSGETLERLATVLRLDRAETEHLFALSSRQRWTSTASTGVSDALFDLVRSVDPVPAYIRTKWLDILAWNPAIADLFVDLGELDPRQRNTLRLTFLYPPYRNLIRDWEEFARSMLRIFCAARAKAPDKTPFDELTESIRAESDEFRNWWPEGEVQSFDEGVKRLRHPTRGLVDLTYVALTPDGQPDLSFVAYMSRPGSED